VRSLGALGFEVAYIRSLTSKCCALLHALLMGKQLYVGADRENGVGLFGWRQECAVEA